MVARGQRAPGRRPEPASTPATPRSGSCGPGATPASPAAATWVPPQLSAPFVALVNSDCLVAPDTLRRLADEAADPGRGPVMASIRLADRPRSTAPATRCTSSGPVVGRRDRRARDPHRALRRPGRQRGLPGAGGVRCGRRSEGSTRSTSPTSRTPSSACAAGGGPGRPVRAHGGGAAPLRVLPQPEQDVPARAQPPDAAGHPLAAARAAGGSPRCCPPSSRPADVFATVQGWGGGKVAGWRWVWTHRAHLAARRRLLAARADGARRGLDGPSHDRLRTARHRLAGRDAGGQRRWCACGGRSPGRAGEAQAQGRDRDGASGPGSSSRVGSGAAGSRSGGSSRRSSSRRRRAPTSSARRRVCSSSAPTSPESWRDTANSVTSEIRNSRLLGVWMPISDARSRQQARDEREHHGADDDEHPDHGVLLAQPPSPQQLEDQQERRQRQDQRDDGQPGHAYRSGPWRCGGPRRATARPMAATTRRR